MGTHRVWSNAAAAKCAELEASGAGFEEILKIVSGDNARRLYSEGGRKETELHHHLMGRADAVEGPMAWIERRPPRWSLSVTKDWPDWPS